MTAIAPILIKYLKWNQYMSLTFCHSLGGLPGQALVDIVQDYNKEHEPQVKLVSISPQDYAAAA